MHIVTQTFHTIHISGRDAQEIVAATVSMVNDHGIDLAEYPVLDNLLGAINGVADENRGMPIVEEENELRLSDDQAEPEIGAPDAED